MRRKLNLGSATAAESAAAAAPTTGMVPAAADEVSALQATIFAAYGNLYQSVNAQAAAIHELFVNTLGASAGSYAATESGNSIATASPLSQGISGLFSSAANAAAADPPGGNLANILNIGFGNWDSASSDLLGMCGGSLLPAVNETGDTAGDAAGAVAGLDGTVLTGAAGPAGSAGLGGVPMVPGLGQAATVGGLSVPPSWAAGAAPAAASPGSGDDRGLDRPGGAEHAGDNHAGRDARDGHGRESRRLGCAAVRRQAHRDGTADGQGPRRRRLTRRIFRRRGIQKWISERYPQRSTPDACTPVRVRDR